MIYLIAFFALSTTLGYFIGHWCASAAASEREQRLHQIYRDEIHHERTK